MLDVLWTRYWLDAQVYYDFENIFNQDNKSAILLENIGKSSSRKRTKHIHMIYYYVAYLIDKDESSLELCPTAYMIGDLMTKPTQSAAIQRFRDQLRESTEVQDPNPRKPKISLRLYQYVWSEGS